MRPAEYGSPPVLACRPARAVQTALVTIPTAAISQVSRKATSKCIPRLSARARSVSFLPPRDDHSNARIGGRHDRSVVVQGATGRRVSRPLRGLVGQRVADRRRSDGLPSTKAGARDHGSATAPGTWRAWFASRPGRCGPRSASGLAPAATRGAHRARGAAPLRPRRAPGCGGARLVTTRCPGSGADRRPDGPRRARDGGGWSTPFEYSACSPPPSPSPPCCARIVSCPFRPAEGRCRRRRRVESGEALGHRRG